MKWTGVARKDYIYIEANSDKICANLKIESWMERVFLTMAKQRINCLMLDAFAKSSFNFPLETGCYKSGSIIC